MACLLLRSVSSSGIDGGMCRPREMDGLKWENGILLAEWAMMVEGDRIMYGIDGGIFSIPAVLPGGVW